MSQFVTKSVSETVELGFRLGSNIKKGCVIAYFGPMGMGKTAFTHGLAKGLGIDDKLVSSPTFALVQDYGGTPPLVHFDMYRIETWEDLYSTGFFEYIDMGAILAVEWSEQIEGALPDDAIRVTFERLSDTDRRITIEGVAL